METPQKTNLPIWQDVDVQRETHGALRAGTLRHWRLEAKAPGKQYRGPRYFKVGRRCLYRPCDIEAFLLADVHDRAAA